MPKLKIKPIRAVHKKIKVHPNRSKEKQHTSNNSARSFHSDSTPCSSYCNLLSKNGYGITQIKIDNEDSLKGDYSAFLQLLHVIINSKSFIEFLCSCRYYVFATNGKKKNYFIMVLSSFLRDVAFASATLPSTISANRFIHYCLKWIPSLRQEKTDSSVFLQQYLIKIDAELRELNAYRFYSWCVITSFLQSVTPLANPFKLITTRYSDETIHNNAQFMVDIPPVISTNALSFSHTCQLQIQKVSPILAIRKSLESVSDPVIQTGSSLLIHCETLERVEVPLWVALPFTDRSDSVAMYLLCTVIAKDDQQFITYKRLFPTSKMRTSKRYIYDLHKGGRWIRMCGESVREISGDELQSLIPCYIHYEQVFH